MTNLLVGLFVLMCIFGVSSFLFRRRLGNILQQERPDVFKEFAFDDGLNRGPVTSLRLAKFILNPSQWPTDASASMKTLQTLRWIEVCYYILFALVVALFLIAFV